MRASPNYQELLEISQGVNWRIDDLIGGERRLDFSKPFLPESLARTDELEFLTAAEKLALNHIRARGYLATFELVEQFILPFLNDQLTSEADDPSRGPALRQFAREEAKHRELFRRYLADFDAEFGQVCGLIGPAEEIGRAVLAHSPLAVTIAILGFEWMSQTHYLESMEEDASLDPQFKNLLKHHWQEEAQHALLDGLMLKEEIGRAAAGDLDRAIDEYVEIGDFFDAGLRAQAELDLASFETASGRTLTPDERERFLAAQHQGLRWSYLGTSMGNATFLEVIEGFSPAARRRLEERARIYH